MGVGSVGLGSHSRKKASWRHRTAEAVKGSSGNSTVLYNKVMSTQNEQKAELLSKTADYYRRSIANYAEFAKTERKPRTKKQLESRLQMVLREIDSLKSGA
jgi:uncharacterized protein with WD repeat